ncbi:MAG: hypothetical protein LBG17_08105 [Bacteroidales bacterium]|nr:hypothetical protein [Bacteroidales bacterium]
MAKSTSKAKDFFAQRQKATPTQQIVESAAKKDEKIVPVEVPPDPTSATIPITQTNTMSEQQQKALGKKEEKVLPENLKKFIEKINFDSKINVNLPVEIDSRLQIALLHLKAKYALNNRQMNKTVLLSYIIDKTLREDEFFGDLA